MTRYRRLFDLMLGGRARVDADMDLEIESHLEMRTADLIRAGMSPDAAREEARRRFGPDTVRGRLHAAARERDAALRQRDRIGSIAADLRHAARQARRAPGFTALCIAMLAVGLGATTAMFTLVQRVLLRPLPFPNAERLVFVTGRDSARTEIPMVSATDWLDWRHARSLEASALYKFPYRQTLLTTDSATRVNAQQVTSDFFRVLGARFIAGRSFTHDEVESSSDAVVIGERLWRAMFAGDSALPLRVRTPNRAYTVVGVVARGQEFPSGTDVWFPIAFPATGEGARVNVNWQMVARLRGDASAEQASAELTTIARGILATDPTALYDYGATARPLADTIVGDAAMYLRLLMATVVFVLLIVCANVAASSLGRATTRAREMAIRSSLGAGRARLVQQLLVEHVWLALVGGTLGLALAWLAIRGVLAWWGNSIPRRDEIAMDGGVFLFALAASLAAGTVAGIIPAVRTASSFSLSAVLVTGSRGTARGGRNLVGAGLVGVEIAIALMLLTGAGLLVRSFRAVIARDIGFDTNVATAEVELSGPLYAQDSLRRFMYWDQLLEGFRTIPGVEAAGASNWIPLGTTGQGFIEVAGREIPRSGAVYRSVSQGFFAALRMPLIAGRTFDGQDGVATQRVVVINQTMAEKFWPGESPIGRMVRATSQEAGPRGQPAPWLTVIGVVGDVRTFGLESDARPEMYVYFRQTGGRTRHMTALVRASMPASQLFDEMRGRARAVDSHVAIDVGTLDARLSGTLATRTFSMSLLTVFAGVAMLLAALGIYGVLSYAVAQRTRELAVRSALGAQRGDLLRIVLGSGLRVVATGVVAGLAASLALARVLESLLVDVSPFDPLSLAVAIVVLVVVCVAAILVPSVRATRLAPSIALTAE